MVGGDSLPLTAWMIVVLVMDDATVVALVVLCRCNAEQSKQKQGEHRTQTEPARQAGLALLLNGDVHCFNASGTDKMDGRTRFL